MTPQHKVVRKGGMWRIALGRKTVGFRQSHSEAVAYAKALDGGQEKYCLLFRFIDDHDEAERERYFATIAQVQAFAQDPFVLTSYVIDEEDNEVDIWAAEARQ